jgi:MFS family permease
LIAVIATDGFDTGEGEFGVLASSFGFGALAGAVLLVFIEQHFAHRHIVVAALLSMSSFVIVAGLVSEVWMGVVVLFLAGLSFTPGVATVVAAMQAHTDDAYRGRVMSLWLMWFGMVSPVAVIAQGFVAEIASIGVALVGTGLLGIATGVMLVSRGIHLAIDPPAV